MVSVVVVLAVVVQLPDAFLSAVAAASVIKVELVVVASEAAVLGPLWTY